MDAFHNIARICYIEKYRKIEHDLNIGERRDGQIRICNRKVTLRVLNSQSFFLCVLNNYYEIQMSPYSIYLRKNSISMQYEIFSN